MSVDLLDPRRAMERPQRRSLRDDVFRQEFRLRCTLTDHLYSLAANPCFHESSIHHFGTFRVRMWRFRGNVKRSHTPIDAARTVAQ